MADQNPEIPNPLNSWCGMIIEAFVTLAQIVACAVVLAVSGDEKPHKPLRVWVMVYLCTSVASLPLLYWRFRHVRKVIAQSFGTSDSGSVVAVECFKWVLDCFFLAWFVVGCVWIFSGTSSRSVAPHLYLMTLAIIIIYIAGYVLRFLICSVIICCFPCILAVIMLIVGSDEPDAATPEAEAKDQIV